MITWLRISCLRIWGFFRYNIYISHSFGDSEMTYFPLSILVLLLPSFTGSAVMLNRRIAAELSKRLAKPWTPSFCKKDNISWTGTKPRAWHKEVGDKSTDKMNYLLNTFLCLLVWVQRVRYSTHSDEIIKELTVISLTFIRINEFVV